jgi:hypothetical protein
MALLQSEVLPTMLGCIWSRVLHRAVTCEENTTELPWTGLFEMVQAIVGVGYTGWSEEASTHIRRDGCPR